MGAEVASRDLVYPKGTHLYGDVLPEAAWVVKNTYTPSHHCYVPGIALVSDEHVSEGSVVQCLECLTYWRLAHVAMLPSWEQVREEAGDFSPVRSRFGFRNTTHGGWTRPWRAHGQAEGAKV